LLRGIVLVVEDDDIFRHACRAILTRAGLQVDAVVGPREALELCERRRYDAILSDIRMPGGDGVTLLQDVRRLDPSVPFILMTGSPTLESAVEAVEHGALRYLQKPFDIDRLLGVVNEAILKRTTSVDLASLNRRFDRGVEGLWMAYQPIVSWAGKETQAFEALLRCEAPEIRGPGDLLELAEKTLRLNELGRAVRSRVAADAARAPDGVMLFVNLHPEDLGDPELYEPGAPLSALARRVVLEITERASVVHQDDLLQNITRLRALGFRVAVDDLGAGYAGLTTFAKVEPEFVKLDASLVRNIDSSPTQQLVVASVLGLARELGILVVAEAIETVGERKMLSHLGVDLMQGYLFARPAKPFVGLTAAALVDDDPAPAAAPRTAAQLRATLQAFHQRLEHESVPVTPDGQ
jgi:EAL domain-containing protein (putative c-di-GMP-specific phosphodiesterase class I)